MHPLSVCLRAAPIKPRKITVPKCLLPVLVLLAAAAPAAADELVAEFSGSDNATTADFRVEGPWLLDWRLDADYDQLMALHVWLIDADTGFAEGRVLRRDSRGNGVRLFEEGGHYRLRVSSTLARWTLRVRQLSPEEAEEYTPREKSRLPGIIGSAGPGSAVLPSP